MNDKNHENYSKKSSNFAGLSTVQNQNRDNVSVYIWLFYEMKTKMDVKHSLTASKQEVAEQREG